MNNSNTFFNFAIKNNTKKFKITCVIVLFILILPTIIAQPKYQSINSKKNECMEDIFLNFAIEKLRKLMSAPSLSVCAIKNDKIVWYKGYGYAQVYKRVKPDINTIYQIGSISKTITTTALLQLYEKGYIDLDDDVNEYLPFSLRNPYYPWCPITIKMLLSHRSSIFDYHFFTKRGMTISFLQSGIPTDLESWLRNSLTSDGYWYYRNFWNKDYAPGEEACYSNTGFLIIGYIVEKVSGKTIEEYCQKNIFKPLEMYNTSFHPDNLNEKQFATPYIKPKRVYIPILDYDTMGFAPIGGVRSSINDLSHFLIAHLNNGVYKQTRILKNSTIQLMHNCIYKGCKIISPLNRMYGLGWWGKNQFGRTIQGHGGMMPGASAYMMINESDSIGYIIMANQFDIFGFFHSFELLLETWSRSLIGELLFRKANSY